MNQFTVSDKEMKEVVADFLEAGHVDNIIAMFRQDHDCFRWTGDLLDDERFMVRMGMVVLFDELVRNGVREVEHAIPSLAALLDQAPAHVRGEAATILGIIGTPAALELLEPLRQDPDAQIREIVGDILDSETSIG